MTEREGQGGTVGVKALPAGDEGFLRAVVWTALREILEAEMTEAVGAAKGERTPSRLGHRSGRYGRTLITRVGKRELRGPVLDRAVRALSTLGAGAGGGVGGGGRAHGVSTRKVKALPLERCGHRSPGSRKTSKRR